jgi:hypothetical protein
MTSAKSLHIGTTGEGRRFTLPHDVVTQTLVVYGGKGMGKTNFGTVLCEELAAARLRFAVLDPMGVFWGLRHSADGKGAGIEVLVLGGRHGDIPIEPTAGAVVADLVADEEADVVIDISRRPDGKMWSLGERIRFVTEYCSRLYERQGERARPLMQIIDEAGRFVPQTIPHGAVQITACVGAIERMVEEGRNVGIGSALITQRSARMNKSVSELADCMIAFRTVGPRSIDAILDWFGEHVEKSRWKELIEKLRALPRGTALVVSPGWLGFEGVADIRMRRTFDSSATPKAGGERRASGPGAKPDLARYQARMAETIQRVKDEDPRELRKRVQELKKQMEQSAKTPATPVSREDDRAAVKALQEANRIHARHNAAVAKSVDVFNRDLARRWSRLAQFIRGAADELSAEPPKLELSTNGGPPPDSPPSFSRKGESPATSIAAGAATATTTATATLTEPARRRTPATAPAPSSGVTGPQQRILDALATYEGFGELKPERPGLAALAGYKIGGHLNNVLGELRAAGLIDYPEGGRVALTDAGRAIANPRDFVSIDDVHRAWFELCTGPQKRLLEVLLDRWPSAIAREQLSDAAAMHGGHFNNVIGELRTMGAAEYPQRGYVRASALLFPEGLS